MATAPHAVATVIIPTLNRLDLLKVAVESFRMHTETPHELIVVDNGNDGTFEWCQQNGVECLKPDEPLTFGESNNLAAKQSKADYLLLLNNDTITDRDFLAELVKVMEAKPRCVMVGCKIIDGDGKLSHAGVAFQENGVPYHPNYGDEPNQEFFNFDRPVNAVTAACVLVRRDAWVKVHGFDPRYENNYEDVDLCLKFRERGWAIWYAHKAVVVHLENQTRGESGDIRPMLRVFMEKWVASGNMEQMASRGALDLQVDEKRLNVGCGKELYEGYINIDIRPGSRVLERDVTRGLPFDDDSIDAIYCRELMEHLSNEDGIFLFNEFVRVLKVGARLTFIVPRHDHGSAFDDPTHKTFWTKNKIAYYDVLHSYHNHHGAQYGIASGMKLIKARRSYMHLSFEMERMDMRTPFKTSEGDVQTEEVDIL